MILPVILYGHPVLRQKGARVESITPAIRQLAADMLETMRAAHGIGLAAQQIGQALQLTVIDVREVTDRPSTLERDGQPADVGAFMPLVLINPEWKPLRPSVPGMEGCLSFPEIYAEIQRPEGIEVNALNLEWERLTFRCGGLLARVIQHEVDHLHGILFIDRMSAADRAELKPRLNALLEETKAALKQSSPPRGQLVTHRA